MKRASTLLVCVTLATMVLAGCNATTDEPTQDSSPASELHILNAKYGANGIFIDVTDQVRMRVRNNNLSVKASNNIAGDPIFGCVKSLRVEYILGDQHKTVQIREGRMLRIPPGDDDHGESQTVKTAKQLIILAKKCPAEIGFYGKNFSTGETVEYRPDQPACLASIVKIFTLLEVMRQADRGILDLSASITLPYKKQKVVCTILDTVDKMIGMSDNIATDALTTYVGYDRVNSLPKQLGIAGLSKKILPEPGVLAGVLDRRLRGDRLASRADLLPQHGTARGIVQYFELLHRKALINRGISERVLKVFDKHPKVFAPGATPVDYRSGGKGGSLTWKRLFRLQYNMVGWGLIIRDKKTTISFCLWSEWFPEGMKQEERDEWLYKLSDGIVNALLSEEANDVTNTPASQPCGRALIPIKCD